MDEILSALYTWICSLGDNWAMAAMVVGAVCAALATVLPAPSEGANVFWRIAYGLINLIGLNFGKAKNASQTGSSGEKG